MALKSLEELIVPDTRENVEQFTPFGASAISTNMLVLYMCIDGLGFIDATE